MEIISFSSPETTRRPHSVDAIAWRAIGSSLRTLRQTTRSNCKAAEGSYLFVRTATGMDLRKIQDENAWRAERFEGLWSASQ